MSLTVTGTTSVNLNTPSILTERISKNVKNMIFTDNTDTQLDRGKNSDSLILSGTETTDVSTKMNSINTLMDSGEEITLSGLDDTNLNTEYIITDFEFNQKAGTTNIYTWTITFERLYDSLG